MLINIHSESDCVILQECIEKLYHWFKKWGMSFNIAKCQVMSVKNINGIIYNYTMNNVLLNHVDEFNDLGILIASNLSWEKQTVNMCAKANKRLGYIRRTLGNSCSSKIKLLC